MYIVMIVLLLGVLPVLSIGADILFVQVSPDLQFAIGRWFVFWAGGVRLVLAGLKQISDPAYTSETIFEIKDTGARKIVQELGFGNLSIGVLWMIAGFHAAWVAPAALVSGLFYGLVGSKHVMSRRRTRIATVAMITDLLMFAILAAFLADRWMFAS